VRFTRDVDLAIDNRTYYTWILLFTYTHVNLLLYC